MPAQAAHYDVIVIGAGAAGLMTALTAGQRDKRVLLLEHTDTIGAKILISGGGRCNFTNLDIRPERFLSANPHFARSALARYDQHAFISLVRKHHIAFYEKTLGQLFCEGNGSARRIVEMLLQECQAGNVEIQRSVAVQDVSKHEHFVVQTTGGALSADAVVIASGGLSIPKLGASDFAYRIAKRFDVPVVAPRPALVPLTFDPDDRAWMNALAGVSVEASVSSGATAFREGLLFTHRGLSGPSILQVSSYWRQGEAITVDFWPSGGLEARLTDAKRAHPKAQAKAAFTGLWPERLAASLAQKLLPEARLADMKDKDLLAVGAALRTFKLTPAGDEGYAKAEVTAGGIDTNALDQKSMAVKAVPGLHFVGEAVDVTGWLGGYNFQWAWASGRAAGLAV
jgi:predicted Rossmann fold flavoprotein